MAKNKKSLLASFNQFSTHSDHNGESRLVTFAQAKKAMESLIDSNFTSIGTIIEDGQLALILNVGLVSKCTQFPIYDFRKVIDVYWKHHQDAQFLG